MLDTDVRFLRDEMADSFAVDLDDNAWDLAVLPHSPRIESIPLEGEPNVTQWQGTCWYRLRFTLGPEAEGRPVFLHFDGAMNVADVWLDGAHLGQNLGGYLPFGFDLSGRVMPGKQHLVAVRLDNRDNPTTGPKPLRQLDFNLYGGLYRHVRLVVKGRLHITDPILANKTGSGGVFVRYPLVTKEEAHVEVQVHVRNADNAERVFSIHALLTDADGVVVAQGNSATMALPRGGDVEATQTLLVSSPALWNPRSPNLYTLTTQIVDGDAVVDEETTRIGIRHIEITSSGIAINGEPKFLRGTNRHQEYPYVGYALSDAAQYRDAQKIKEAGFDYVRLSHYPHSPAFLDACDALGIAVMDAIPGWQYFNSSPEFRATQLENVRRMLRRDRNHPSVILWEVSLNESEMPADFVAEAHQIAHAEYPGDQCYTSGWKPGYDVFLRARQHGGCAGITAQPCLVSEYGDWEYYAGNAGLNQEGWSDLAPDEANSRKLRWQGEKGLLQQATNFQEAHGANRSTSAIADGLWVMFDYLRGYAPDIESSGCMDLFRLPKFAYYFFQSQREATERYAETASGPMVFIASHWLPESSTDVRVFSNCDEVALYLNDVLIERRAPDTDALSAGVARPPFTFHVPSFEPGVLEAVAYVDGEEAARHSVRTPGPARALELSIDTAGRPFAALEKDLVFVHAELMDAAGTVLPEAWENVFFGATGVSRLVGENPFATEAGIASILLEADAPDPGATVYAMAIVDDNGAWRVLGASAGVDGDGNDFEIRVTLDGSAPGPGSSLYEDLLTADRVRAVLLVDGQPVVEADTGAPRRRTRGSAAPA